MTYELSGVDVNNSGLDYSVSISSREKSSLKFDRHYLITGSNMQECPVNMTFHLTVFVADFPDKQDNVFGLSEFLGSSHNKQSAFAEIFISPRQYEAFMENKFRFLSFSLDIKERVKKSPSFITRKFEMESFEFSNFFMPVWDRTPSPKVVTN